MAYVKRVRSSQNLGGKRRHRSRMRHVSDKASHVRVHVWGPDNMEVHRKDLSLLENVTCRFIDS